MLKQRVRGRRDRKKRFDREWNGLIVEAYRALSRARQVGVIIAVALAVLGLLIPNGYVLLAGCAMTFALLMSRPRIDEEAGDGLLSDDELSMLDADAHEDYAAGGAGDVAYNAVLGEITRLVNSPVRVIVMSSHLDQRPISSAAGILHDAAPAGYDPDPDEHADLAFERLFFRVGADADNGFFLDRTQFALGYARAERGDDLALVVVDDEVTVRIYAQAPAPG
jgi:hypothetical protein